MFSGTIFDNLKVGNENATYQEMVVACQLSGASDFIEKMPNRYGAFVDEGGSNLSGGEKQRLAIARALISDSQIYIFDEASSHLDSFSEQKLQNLIFNQIDKTTIIIAHRLSTIMNCDYIFLLMKEKLLNKEHTMN